MKEELSRQRAKQAQRPLNGDQFQFQCGWNIVVGVEPVGRGQIMQGLEGHAKALRFYSHCDVDP